MRCIILKAVVSRVFQVAKIVNPSFYYLALGMPFLFYSSSFFGTSLNSSCEFVRRLSVPRHILAVCLGLLLAGCGGLWA